MNLNNRERKEFLFDLRLLVYAELVPVLYKTYSFIFRQMEIIRTKTGKQCLKNKDQYLLRTTPVWNGLRVLRWTCASISRTLTLGTAVGISAGLVDSIHVCFCVFKPFLPQPEVLKNSKLHVQFWCLNDSPNVAFWGEAQKCPWPVVPSEGFLTAQCTVIYLLWYFV